MPSSNTIELPSPGPELAYQSPVSGPLVVTSTDEYTRVAEHLKTLKTFQARVAQWFAPLKQKAQAAHRALCDEERKILQPAVDDEVRIKRALVVYTTEQDRIRRDEQQRLREEARRQDEQRRLDEAAALEREAQATGDVSLQEAAEALIATPAALMPVEPETPAAPKVEGLSYRQVYRAEVVHLPALVKASQDVPAFAGLVEANQAALDALARGMKEAFSVPGCRLVIEKIPITRRMA